MWFPPHRRYLKPKMFRLVDAPKPKTSPWKIQKSLRRNESRAVLTLLCIRKYRPESEFAKLPPELAQQILKNVIVYNDTWPPCRPKPYRTQLEYLRKDLCAILAWLFMPFYCMLFSGGCLAYAIAKVDTKSIRVWLTVMFQVVFSIAQLIITGVQAALLMTAWSVFLCFTWVLGLLLIVELIVCNCCCRFFVFWNGPRRPVRIKTTVEIDPGSVNYEGGGGDDNVAKEHEEEEKENPHNKVE